MRAARRRTSAISERLATLKGEAKHSTFFIFLLTA